MVGIASSSELASPMINNDRYHGYQDNRLIPDQNMIRHNSHHNLGPIQWSNIQKQERSASVPNSSMVGANYSCYINNTSNGQVNRQSNLNIFVGNATPPPQQSAALHSPSFINCAQQQLRNECNMQQNSLVGSINDIEQHHTSRQVQGNIVHTPTSQREPQNQDRQNPMESQQSLIQTPTHQSEADIASNTGVEERSWTSDGVIIPLTREKQVYSNSSTKTFGSNL